jgi:hypothetical protein
MSAVSSLARLPSIARRFIALGVLALVVALVWWLVLTPARALVSSQQHWREHTAMAIGEDRAMVKQAESLRAARKALDASPLPMRLFVSNASGNPELQLQEELRSALAQSGVQPTNFKVLPAETFQGLRAHRVEFASSLTIDQLRAFFIALDARPRFVRIERLRLSAPSNQRMDENPRLNALMEARGYSVDAPVSSERVAHAR